MADFEPNLEPEPLPKIPLPKGWTDLVLIALLHVTALARIAILNARIWPDGAAYDGLRLRAENDRLRTEIALLERELAIKDARFNRLAPKKRPEYLPTERFEILFIKTMRGLNNSQLARRFQVTVQTIQSWMHGVSTQNKLVQLSKKVTRYPDYLRQMGFAVFPKQPMARDVIEALERIGLENNVLSKYLVLDRGVQFDCTEFCDWCRSKDVKTRFGKVGEHGSIARVERFHRTMKDECKDEQLMDKHTFQLSRFYVNDNWPDIQIA